MKFSRLSKRLLSIITAVMCISLSACGYNTTDPKGEQSSMPSSTAATTVATILPTAPVTRPTLPDNHENVPAALTVGDPDFTPGTYYKDSYPVLQFRQEGDQVVFGTWWWYLHRIVAPDDNGLSVDMALDMLIANHIDEIYLDIGAMVPWEIEEEQGGLSESDDANDLVSELAVRGFVKKCSQHGIRVAALGGSSEDAVVTWLDPQYEMIHMKNLVSKVEAYNANAAEDEKFYGVHLDVEPFTESQYGANRDLRNQWTADLIIAARQECDRIGVELGWDIWAWTAETDMVTNQYGEKVNILDVYARECDTLCIMAYTNTAEGQYERGTDLELAYAQKYDCTLIVATEHSKISPASTTYYYSTMQQTLESCQKLRRLIDAGAYHNMGGAIHHVASFWQYMTRDQA